MRTFARDFRERFLNFETVKGMLFLAGCVYLFYHPEWILRAFVVYLGYEGLRKMLVNRTKQEIRQEHLKRAAKGQTSLLLLFAFLLPLCTASLPPTSAVCGPGESNTCRVTTSGVDLIKRWEGYVPVTYIDAAGYATICWGHLIDDPAEAARLRGRALTAEECQRIFAADLDEHAGHVRRYVTQPLTEHQFSAFTSLDFNIGPGNFRQSSALRYANQGRHELVPERIKLWVYAGGRKLRGLERRRAAEAEMYQAGASLSCE